jgi:hypothetical protein
MGHSKRLAAVRRLQIHIFMPRRDTAKISFSTTKPPKPALHGSPTVALRGLREVVGRRRTLVNLGRSCERVIGSVWRRCGDRGCTFWRRGAARGTLAGIARNRQDNWHFCSTTAQLPEKMASQRQNEARNLFFYGNYGGKGASKPVVLVWG